MAQPHEIIFSHDLPTRLAPQQVWAELEKAFQDSGTSVLWPTELCRVHGTRGIVEGAQVRVGYRFLGFESPMPYTLSEVKPGERFRYEAADGHPFVGGARVWIEPTPLGCTLHWYGRYTYTGFSPASVFFRLYFERAFFGNLRRNLRWMEAASHTQTRQGQPLAMS
jgi:hypothetical protein